MSLNLSLVRVNPSNSADAAQMVDVASRLLSTDGITLRLESFESDGDSHLAGPLPVHEIVARVKSMLGDVPTLAATSQDFGLRWQSGYREGSTILLSDFHWEPPEMDTETRAVRWVFAIVQSTLELKASSSCTRPNCILNPLSFVLDSTQLILCSDCESVFSTISDVDVGLMHTLAGWFQRMIKVRPRLYYLANLGRIDLVRLGEKRSTLRINNDYINELAKDLLKVEDANAELTASDILTRCAQRLPSVALNQLGVSTESLVADSADVDSLLYLTRKRHRDHSLHQFQVAVTGLELLRSTTKSRRTLGSEVARAIAGRCPVVGPYESEWLDWAWCVAALSHDIGYPLEHFCRVLTSLRGGAKAQMTVFLEVLRQSSNSLSRFLRGRISQRRIDNEIRQLRTEMAREIGWKAVPFDSLMKRVGAALPHGRYNHGLLSALMLWSATREYVIAAPGSTAAAWLGEAIQAIALHDSAHPIDFNQAPLASLLKFCDELHEWGREVLVEGVAESTAECSSVTLHPVDFEKGPPSIGEQVVATFEFGTGITESKWELAEFIKCKQALKRTGMPFRIEVQVLVSAI